MKKKLWILLPTLCLLAACGKGGGDKCHIGSEGCCPIDSGGGGPIGSDGGDGGGGGGGNLVSKLIALDTGGEELWSKDNAWFAAYVWNGDGSSKWFKLEQETEKNIYSAEIDKELYSNIIFVRMDPAKTELNWDSKWNQTVDLTFGGNCYKITSWESGEWVTRN